MADESAVKRGVKSVAWKDALTAEWSVGEWDVRAAVSLASWKALRRVAWTVERKDFYWVDV